MERKSEDESSKQKRKTHPTISVYLCVCLCVPVCVNMWMLGVCVCSCVTCWVLQETTCIQRPFWDRVSRWRRACHTDLAVWTMIPKGLTDSFQNWDYECASLCQLCLESNSGHLVSKASVSPKPLPFGNHNSNKFSALFGYQESYFGKMRGKSYPELILFWMHSKLTAVRMNMEINQKENCSFHPHISKWINDFPLL